LTARKVVLSANTGWFVVQFLDGLIRGLKAADYTPIIVAPDELGADSRVADLGAEWIPLAIERKGTNPVADLRLFRAYRRTLKLAEPVAFLGFTVKPNIFGCLASRSLDIPSIATISGLGTAFMNDRYLERIVTFLYRSAFRRNCTVLFQNPDDYLLFIERSIVKAEQTRIMPGLGVDLEEFAVAALPEGPPTFLFVGRLLRDKGVYDYISAARALRRQFPRVRFQLLGSIDEGNRTAISPDELASWVNEGIVEYLGETRDVRPFLARATIVVLPSYREGLPSALLEAAAMGRPLVAADVPGCREVVDHGANGFLCRAGDVESLTNAMRKMCELPRQTLHQMAASSRNRVHERFSKERVVRAYLDILTGVGSVKKG
jgi:glycosyltransferase involved in cell wall biosynthesis